MTWIILLLLTLVVAVSLLYPTVFNDQITAVLMTPVVIFTLVALISWQLPAPHLLALYCVAGAAFGALLLVALLPLSAPSPASFLHQCKSGLWAVTTQSELRYALLFNSLFIVYEEIIWRVFLMASLTLLMPAWLAIPIAAGLFWYVHADNRQWSGHSAEFLIFSLIITTIYAVSESLVAAISMHAGRNLLILAQGYQMEQAET